MSVGFDDPTLSNLSVSDMHQYLTQDNLLMKTHPRFDEIQDYMDRYPSLPLGSNPAHRRILREILKHYKLAIQSVNSSVRHNVETLDDLFKQTDVGPAEVVSRLKALSERIPILKSNDLNRPMELPVPKNKQGVARSPAFYKNNPSRRILPSDPSNSRSEKKLYSCPPPAIDVEYEDPADGKIRYLRDYNGDRSLINVRKGQAPTCEIQGKQKDDDTFEFGEDNFEHLKERLRKLGTEGRKGSALAAEDRIPEKYLNGDDGANQWLADYAATHTAARQAAAKNRRMAARSPR